MAKKRGKTFHAYFCIDGIRYRESLHTSDWREAQRLEKELIARAKEGKLAAKRSTIDQLTFREAAEQFIMDPARDIKPLSRKTEIPLNRDAMHVLRALYSRSQSSSRGCSRSLCILRLRERSHRSD